MKQRFLILLVITAYLSSVTMAIGENCIDHGVHFQPVFTVPGEAAMLSCTLDHNSPYNISWFKEGTERELSDNEGKIMVRAKELWFLNSDLQDAGNYVCILRTHDQCWRETLVLIVNNINPEYCGRPQKTEQELTVIANGYLSCPLFSYMEHVDSYSFQWFKDCEPIVQGGKFKYVRHLLLIQHVSSNDMGYYTCRMTFNLTGTTAHVSETISCEIIDQWNLLPAVVEPINDLVKAEYGSPFTKVCRVFVPGEGENMVHVHWAAEDFISWNSSQRVNQVSLKSKVEDGEWMEVVLHFTEVEKEDFYHTYRCMVFNEYGLITGNFTLLPSDPNYLPHQGLFFCLLILIFITAIGTWRVFRVDLVLCCRTYCARLYKDPGVRLRDPRGSEGVISFHVRLSHYLKLSAQLPRESCPFLTAPADHFPSRVLSCSSHSARDGKVYDAYVAYLRSCEGEDCRGGACGAVEEFALCVLPQVMEGEWGYRLFILGRDSFPGEAIADAVQRNIQRSRRLLLLYSASSFSHPDATLHLEQQLATHGALVEGGMRVILVELGEAVNDALLPESVRYLRSRQGALCWRGAQSEQGCLMRLRSNRFWKHLQYHMPARSSCKHPTEKNFLTHVYTQVEG
ncbi:interleukin-1 receptor type 1 isoform X2 [Scleropages formosus]|uniref:interleukin-1 receptor type 1 isoform X2 n=1 Tax=Scleropages formosus TaxID=113540 RepID=UPI0010FAA9F6|nr:interleukin-1 receptor type 1-like isoform X2 [Scleropages formosus]